MIASLRQVAANPKMPSPRNRAVVTALHAVGAVLSAPSRVARISGGLVSGRGAGLDRPERERPAGPTALPASPRILLMRVDGIGDLVMTTPLFPALRRAYPRARIDLLCSTAARDLAELFVRSGDIDRLYALPLGNPPWPIFRPLLSRLRANRYDVAADLRGDFRNVLTAWLAGVPRRYGMAYAGLDYLLTRTLPAQNLGRDHQTDEVCRMGELLGVPSITRRVGLPLPANLREFARQWLEQRGVRLCGRDSGSDPNSGDSGRAAGGDTAGPDRPLAAFHLSAYQEAKLWPLDRFVAVAHHLQDARGARVLVIGGPDDRDRAAAFSAALREPALIAAGQTSLPQTAALLQRCGVFVGTDSGPAHVASAVGCPLVVLFGPANVHINRPYADAATVLTSPRPCDRRCDGKTCAVPERHCLKAITVQDVTAAADTWLARRETPRGTRLRLTVAGASGGP